MPKAKNDVLWVSEMTPLVLVTAHRGPICVVLITAHSGPDSRAACLACCALPSRPVAVSGFVGFYPVLSGFIRFYPVLSVFPPVLSGFGGFYRALVGFGGLSWVWVGFSASLLVDVGPGIRSMSSRVPYKTTLPLKTFDT